MLLVEITVTKGLSELKMLDKRIRRKLRMQYLVAIL